MFLPSHLVVASLLKSECKGFGFLHTSPVTLTGSGPERTFSNLSYVVSSEWFGSFTFVLLLDFLMILKSSKKQGLPMFTLSSLTSLGGQEKNSEGDFLTSMLLFIINIIYWSKFGNSEDFLARNLKNHPMASELKKLSHFCLFNHIRIQQIAMSSVTGFTTTW